MKDFWRKLKLNSGIVGDLFAFLWRRRLWWLIPIIAVMLIFGFLIALGTATGLGPLIYTLF
jgi:hypothetical protein